MGSNQHEGKVNENLIENNNIANKIKFKIQTV